MICKNLNICNIHVLKIVKRSFIVIPLISRINSHQKSTPNLKDLAVNLVNDCMHSLEVSIDILLCKVYNRIYKSFKERIMNKFIVHVDKSWTCIKE